MWYGNEVANWVWYGNEVANWWLVLAERLVMSILCTQSWSLQETPGVWECDTGSNQPSCEGASQLKETTATEKHRAVTNDNDNSTGWWVNSCSRLYCVVYSFIPNFLLLGLCLSNTWMNGKNGEVLGLFSLVPRPSYRPAFDRLQYAKVKGWKAWSISLREWHLCLSTCR